MEVELREELEGEGTRAEAERFLVLAIDSSAFLAKQGQRVTWFCP